ncbi:dopamine D2-like receptor [Caerostris extrusa]|uniref:Dopamine D2-like receptor n=1 Tax=Caerostris extrusa TaxID=172846 RepID=A0AAV4MPY8_CAEEX|nr:dopamine D2-like receptor [Caerostris extrusa]
MSQVNGDWELSDTLCDFYIAVDVTCSTASIFNLVAISIDRALEALAQLATGLRIHGSVTKCFPTRSGAVWYIAVTQPIKYSKHKNSTRVSLTIAIVWLVSAAIGSPIVLGLNTSPERTPQLCVFYNSDFIIYSSLSSFYIPCLVMIFLYYKIFKAIHARARKNKLRAGSTESGAYRSTGTSSLTTEPAGSLNKQTLPSSSGGQSSRGLQIVVEKDGLTTNTGSGSQDDDYDDDTAGDDSYRQESVRGATAASAMLLSAFMTETIRIEIPINGNTDSGYGTSHVEQETQFTGDQPSPRHNIAAGIDLAAVRGQQKKNGLSKRKGEQDGSDMSSGTKKKSRFNLKGRHKSSRKKREKSLCQKREKGD